MGQKIHPTGFRLAVTRNWTSKWFANSKHFAPTLKEDIKIREYLKKKLGHASVGKITIERPAKNARITIYSARPGSSSARRARTSRRCARICAG
jgi:small subunit ribosomal protein S3